MLVGVTDSNKPSARARLEPFEGMWLITKPSGAVACAKIYEEKLLIPYSFGGGGKLTGHYFDCKVHEQRLFCRFENFDSVAGGIMFLSPAPNETLTGGRWMNDQISENIRKDPSLCSESLPNMQPLTWIRISNQEPPEWAEKYFGEDWPNKF